jgi:hypothetical protein
VRFYPPFILLAARASFSDTLIVMFILLPALLIEKDFCGRYYRCCLFIAKPILPPVRTNAWGRGSN